MERKIPPEAFDFYLSLGVKRSYQAVAEHFNVSKSAVVGCAKREEWQKRVAQIDAKARAATDTKAVQSREELIDHHLKLWQAVERRSLEALRAFPLSSAIDAVRALNMATRNTMLLRGEPTDRVENLESMIRTAHERWLTRGDEDEVESGDGDSTDADAGDSANHADGQSEDGADEN
jgi:predicted DNA-binding protein YlxM (UPF0122 family)